MDPSIAPIHHQPPTLQPSPHDPSSFLYDHNPYGPVIHQSTSGSWTPPSHEGIPSFHSPPSATNAPLGSPVLPSQTATDLSSAPPQVRGNRAPAILKGQQNQQLSDHHAMLPSNTPSQFQMSANGTSVLSNGDASLLYGPSGSAYTYQPLHEPRSPSSQGDLPEAPNRPPQVTSRPIDPMQHQTSLESAFSASIDSTNGFHPTVLGDVTAAPPYDLQHVPSAAYTGPNMSSFGPGIMRVPSASPSEASAGRRSPLTEFSPARRRYRSGSSSQSGHHSRDSYDFSESGPISPLSSVYGHSALPSSLASMANGYLHHGSSEPQGGQSSPTAITNSQEPLLPSATSAGSSTGANGRGVRGQKTKTKLTDMDRKFICVYAQNHPKARQEDIATKFNVERSTVSKILKSKDKWMKVDFFSSEARTVKHRPSKFPEIEATLINNLRLRAAAREPVNDAFIKKMALELAQERGIGKDKFKASSGWVENFKHRHEIRKGVWEKWTGSPNSKPGRSSGNSQDSGIGDAQSAIGEDEYPDASYEMGSGDASMEYGEDAEESNLRDEALANESLESEVPLACTPQTRGPYAARRASHRRLTDPYPVQSAPGGIVLPVSTPMSMSFSTPHNVQYPGAASPSTASPGLTLSRSESTASIASQTTSPLARLNRGSPSSISSSSAEVIFSAPAQPDASFTAGNGLGFHRRSFSASHTTTSSPLSSTSSSWTDGGFEPSSFGITNNFDRKGLGPSKLGPRPTGLAPPSRRSMTYSSFSALGGSIAGSGANKGYTTDLFTSSPRSLPQMMPTSNAMIPLPEEQGSGQENGHERIDLASDFSMNPPSNTPNIAQRTGSGHHRAHSMLELPDLAKSSGTGSSISRASALGSGMSLAAKTLITSSSSIPLLEGSMQYISRAVHPGPTLPVAYHSPSVSEVYDNW